MVRNVWRKQWINVCLYHFFHFFLTYPTSSLFELSTSPKPLVWNQTLALTGSHQFLRVLSLWHLILYPASSLMGLSTAPYYLLWNPTLFLKESDPFVGVMLLWHSILHPEWSLCGTQYISLSSSMELNP